MEDVTEQIERLEGQEPSLHLAQAKRAERRRETRPQAFVFALSRARQPRQHNEERDRGHREREERATPTDSDPEGAGEQHRSADVAERTRERPARHVPLALVRRSVHERRLREAHEGARRRVADHERREQRPEPDRTGARGRRELQTRAPPQTRTARRCLVSPSAPTSGSSALPTKPGNGEEQSDLRVAQMEVTADQRPRRSPRATDELVEQLDCEQHRHERGRARGNGSRGAANAHGGIVCIAQSARLQRVSRRRTTRSSASFVVCVSNLREVLSTKYDRMRKGLHWREASETLCRPLRVHPGRKPGVPGECQPRQLSYFRR